MSDIFQEVDEALKQEKVETFWKENGPYIIGACILAIILTALFSFYRGWQSENNKAETSAFLTAIEQVETSDPVFFDPLVSFIDNTSSNLAGLASLRGASIALQKENKTQGIAFLENMIADDLGSSLYQDYALLIKTALQATETQANPLELAENLMTLTKSRSPLRFNAFEQQASLYIQAQDFVAAQDVLNFLLAHEKTPRSIQDRARKILHVLQYSQTD